MPKACFARLEFSIQNPVVSIHQTQPQLEKIKQDHQNGASFALNGSALILLNSEFWLLNSRRAKHAVDAHAQSEHRPKNSSE